jgi:hypothetical protein
MKKEEESNEKVASIDEFISLFGHGCPAARAVARPATQHVMHGCEESHSATCLSYLLRWEAFRWHEVHALLQHHALGEILLQVKSMSSNYTVRQTDHSAAKGPRENNGSADIGEDEATRIATGPDVLPSRSLGPRGENMKWDAGPGRSFGNAKSENERKARKKFLKQLRRDTSGTGVIEAGRIAQLRRGRGATQIDPDRIISGRVNRRSAVSSARPVMSGKQRLLEERKLVVTQRKGPQIPKLHQKQRNLPMPKSRRKK